jgi:hypothetical protein
LESDAGADIGLQTGPGASRTMAAMDQIVEFSVSCFEDLAQKNEFVEWSTHRWHVL